MKKLSYYTTGSLLIFCLLMIQLAAADVQPRLISISGVGEVKLEPDEVVVSIGIEIRDVSLHTAQAEVDKRASDVIAYLKKQGIEDKYIQTSYITLQPYYSYYGSGTGKTTPDYYIAQKTMTFVLKELSKYDSIMSGLYDVGINQVNDISFKM